MEPSCLRCGEGGAEVGVLCGACARALVSNDDALIPDHLTSNVDPEDAVAWLVDRFGNAHALAAKSMIGRSDSAQMSIVTASVSREHARLEREGETWHVRDLGSRNGTFIDDTRLQPRGVLRHRSRLRVGHVLLWFLSEVPYQPAESVTMATATAVGGLERFALRFSGVELCVVGNVETAGGTLLARPVDANAWTSELELAALEYQLLRALCLRGIEDAASPSTIRGCVATKQLARDLPFQSRFANEENVRQVVRRVRGVLQEVGAAGLLGVAPGRGYYLACPIAPGG